SIGTNRSTFFTHWYVRNARLSDTASPAGGTAVSEGTAMCERYPGSGILAACSSSRLDASPRPALPSVRRTLPPSIMADLDTLVSLSKRRGFIFPSSEIYGGLSAVYDYGPLGVELKRNVRESWWHEMVYLHYNIEGVDAAILMHPTTWKASGHVDAFSDPLIDDKASGMRYRADQLIEGHIARLKNKGKDEDAERVQQRLVEALHADDMNQALYDLIISEEIRAP